MTTPVLDAGLLDDIERMLDPLLGPALAKLDDALADTGLSTDECAVVRHGTLVALRENVWRRVSRVVLLELNAARITGRLTAADPPGRWQEWVQRLTDFASWEEVVAPYPPLMARLHTVIGNRCTAALQLAHRFARERRTLGGLLEADPGHLVEVEFGAGDSHRGGQTVTTLRCDGGRLVYKPRSLAVDVALGGLLPRLLVDEPAHRRIRVPVVLPRHDEHGDYGWAEHVPHRYCEDDDELRSFYRGLGHWLAVMRLLGGSDLHNENMIAAGPVPVVVDCETLFTPHYTAEASGYGGAADRAADLLNSSVLRIGLLPGRAAALGFRGVDPSAAGFLPSQQPTMQMPVVVDGGTDSARIGVGEAPLPPAANHPSPEPDLGYYWPRVVEGFAELTDGLRARDRAGELEPLLTAFADSQIRVVPRDTMSYVEIGRMLWHPASLHEPTPAVRRATELLARHAENRPGAPDDPEVIRAEIAELLDGDVPVFTTTPRCGQLTGPGGTRWGKAENLVSTALHRWRTADPATDRQVIQAALVGAYLNEGGRSASTGMLPVPTGRPADLERCRREQTAGIITALAEHAVWGADGTVTWIAPVLGPTGWAVQSLPPDLYGGSCGVAVLLAAYLGEVDQGRADEREEARRLLPAVLRTCRMAEDQHVADRAAAAAAGITARPAPAGGYIGLGSRIWSWLLLARLGAVDEAEAVQRAVAVAEWVPEAVAADETHDLLVGAAGAVVPLLALSVHTGDGRWQEVAAGIGDRLAGTGIRDGGGARWSSSLFPDAVGGLSHGSAGIGWALARLAAASGSAAHVALAEEAFAFADSLYDAQLRDWRDTRTGGGLVTSPVTWCHGAVGQGICAADLLARCGGERQAGLWQADRWRDQLRRAAEVAWHGEGFGWSHTLCHGDLSAWELMRRAEDAGVAPRGFDRGELASSILASVAQSGPTSGLARDAFEPGLLPGLGGVAYQLLRMHPEADLPSVLLPDPPSLLPDRTR